MPDFFLGLTAVNAAVTIFKPINSTGGFLLAILACLALFGLVFFALHRLPPQGKKWLMIITTFIAGLFYTTEFFWPSRALHGNQAGQTGNWLTPIVTEVSSFLILIVIWTFGLGLISLTLVHWKRLAARHANWYHSLVFFLALISIIVVGLLSRTGRYADIYTTAHDGSLAGANSGALKAGIVFQTLFDGLLINLDASMFALLAFYIASAAYRAFRVRTLEAGLLMFAALVVMLGLVDIGVTLTNWIPLESRWAFFRLENFAGWILNVWNMPGQRAVTIGVAIGALAMAMRLWLSLERGTFFSQEK